MSETGCFRSRRGGRPVHGVTSSSVSDIIDSHCQQQKHPPITQHVSTDNDNACQSHDGRRGRADPLTHYPRPPMKPLGVTETNENDRNRLNRMLCNSPQPWQHATNLRGPSADIPLRQPSKPAGRNVPFVEHGGSDMLRLAEPPSELQHVDNGQWIKSMDSEYGWVFVQQRAATLPRGAPDDGSVRRPLCELVSSCLLKPGQCETLTGRHLAEDNVPNMLPGTACYQPTSASSRDLFYSTALESTGQFLHIVLKFYDYCCLSVPRNCWSGYKGPIQRHCQSKGHL